MDECTIKCPIYSRACITLIKGSINQAPQYFKDFPMSMKAQIQPQLVTSGILGLLLLPVSFAESATTSNATSRHAMEAKVESTYGVLEQSRVCFSQLPV